MVYAQIAMKYKQTLLVFMLLTYNLISKYMLTSWIQRQKLIQKPSAVMGNYEKGIQDEINLLHNSFL